MNFQDLMHYFSSAYALNIRTKKLKQSHLWIFSLISISSGKIAFKIDQKLKCHSEIVLIDFIWQF